MKDSYRHQGLRKQLVGLLREKGIKDKRVLDAIAKVPRHLFLDPAFLEHAYEDRAIQIGEDQTISQPYTVACQTELLELSPNDKVLEVGTGSGYQACVLTEMEVQVYSIERNRNLYKQTNKLLKNMGYAYIKTYFGDGYEGLAQYAPFDKILITAATDRVPSKLIEQLMIGGRLVAPVGGDKIQKMTVIVKTSEQQYETKEKGVFRFVPLLPGKKM